MLHRQVYDIFRDIFPNNVDENTIWFPNGKNSIRIRGVVGLYSYRTDYVFTYFKKNNWRLETVDCYIKHMKGE